MPPWLLSVWPHSPGEWWTAIGVVVAVTAIMVSTAAILVARRTASRQNELHARMLELETARERDRIRQTRSAELRASIQREEPHWKEARLADTGPRHSLVVRNYGAVTARDVRVLLDGRPALEHSLVLRGEHDITVLGPGADFGYVLAVTFSSARVLGARIEWQDDSGESRRAWESQLKV